MNAVNVPADMRRAALATRVLLGGGVVGPVLFIVVLLIEGATRPGYSAWQTDGSYLALGNQGWEQIANFLVSGLLCIGGAVGMARVWRTGRASVWGPRLVGLFGLGLVAAGMFVADPGGGYPPGAPINGAPQTWHGWVHGINGFVLFNVVLPAACFVFARRFAVEPHNRRWTTYSWLTGALLLGVSIPSTVGVPIAQKYAGFPMVDGLIQRVLIVVGFGWVALTALHLLRQKWTGAAEPVVDGSREQHATPAVTTRNLAS